ncbi:uncharacterized protein PEZ65_022280 [Lycodopsis pacificus]
MAAEAPVDVGTMSKTEILRGIVADKLTTAAQEIFAVVQRTVAGYEEEASGLRQEIDRQRRLLERLAQPVIKLDTTDMDSGDFFGHAEEEEEEEPAQSSSLDQEDLRDPDHQSPVERTGAPLILRVGLLQDSQSDEVKAPVQEVRCPRGLQEPDFLDLLRSTFPPLTGPVDAFTTDADEKLRPLSLQTLTPEEVQRSIGATGRAAAALYIRAKAPPQSKDKDVEDARSGENCPHAREDISGESLASTEEAHSRSVTASTSADGHERGSVVRSTPKKLRGAVGLKNHSCQHCDKSFTTSRYLKIHERGHSEEKPYGCDRCTKAFTTPVELKKHRRVHTGEELHGCDQCGKRFCHVSSLKAHQRTHTGEKPYGCEQCGQMFTHLPQLKIHQRSHTGEKPYGCDLCEKVFATRGVRKIHMHVHAAEKTHICEFCGKTSKTSSDLKIHRRIHTGEKPYSCDLCERTFTTRGHLKIHRRVHTGEKPYACDQCGKVFAAQSTLKSHRRSHTGERPYSCDQCGKSFTIPRHLKTHRLIHTREKP